MAKKLSTEKILQNQRIAIWLIVGFVAFITLWFVYSVKTLQTTSMTTASEARNARMNTGACSKQINSRYGVNPKTWSSRFGGRTYTEHAFCCKEGSRYVWRSGRDCTNKMYPQP